MKMKRKILILFCLVVLIAICVTSVSYAGEDHPVTDALKQYMESVTESDFQVSYEDELATFTIYSEGTGRTTWQDAVCETNAYDAVRQESLRDKISSIRIRIIDSKRAVVYDSVNDHVNETVRTIKSNDSNSPTSALSNAQDKIGKLLRWI